VPFWVIWISARIIRGDTPEIVRAVKLCEIEENLNRRKLSPALRKMYTAQLKVFYEEQHALVLLKDEARRLECFEPFVTSGRCPVTLPRCGERFSSDLFAARWYWDTTAHL
jgi:hypothetical protein